MNSAIENRKSKIFYLPLKLAINGSSVTCRGSFNCQLTIYNCKLKASGLKPFLLTAVDGADFGAAPAAKMFAEVTELGKTKQRNQCDIDGNPRSNAGKK